MRRWLIKLLVGTRPILMNVDIEMGEDGRVWITCHVGMFQRLIAHNAYVNNGNIDQLGGRRRSVREHYAASA